MILGGALLSGLSGTVFAASTSTAQFLRLNTGSRPLAMGGAFTAIGGDLQSMHYNMAGLGEIVRPGVSLMHQERFADTRLESASWAQPLETGVLGVGANYFWIPPFEEIDLRGQSRGNTRFYNLALSGGYALEMWHGIYAGVSAKILRNVVDDYEATGVGLDSGLLWGLPVPNLDPQGKFRSFYLGFSLQNMGLDLDGEPIPRVLRSGLAYYLSREWLFSLDVVSDLEGWGTLVEDSDFLASHNILLGVEYSFPAPQIFIRGGMELNQARNIDGVGQRWSVGTGYRFTALGNQYQVDGGVGYNPLTGTQYHVTLMARFSAAARPDNKKAARRDYLAAKRELIQGNLSGALEKLRSAEKNWPGFRAAVRERKRLERILEARRAEKSEAEGGK